MTFLGDVSNVAFAKTAFGVLQWAPERCVAQLRFSDCDVDTGLADMSVDQAIEAGAKSLLIGSAPIGGSIQDNWLPTLLNAISSGMDIISGLHTRLADYPALRQAAKKSRTNLIDVRVPPPNIPIGNGQKRSGQRVLTVGTDCSVGKKYTALAITKELKAQGIDCDFRATGQTGIIISGSGIPIDAVVADFIAGAAESLSPNNDDGHWDVIEGQGSLFQPAYSGVSLGLLHGSQPDAIVMCHDPTRDHIIGCPGHTLPSILQCIETNLRLARLTNPAAACVGISMNTSLSLPDQRQSLLDTMSKETGLACVDPILDGVRPIIQTLLRLPNF